MKTIIKIKTWSCSCGYQQDFEPTQENMDNHYRGLKANECPSCALKKLKGTLQKEVDSTKKIILTVIGEEDIEDEILEDDKEKIKSGKSQMTNEEKITYRLKRKQDIQDAINKAKLLENI